MAAYPSGVPQMWWTSAYFAAVGMVRFSPPPPTRIGSRGWTGFGLLGASFSEKNRPEKSERSSRSRAEITATLSSKRSDRSCVDLLVGRHRSDRFEESVHVVASLLRERRTTFDGRYYQLHDAPNQPEPVQERLPVLVAGKGERRTLRTAAKYAEVWHTWGTPESFAAKSAVLDQRCSEVDRDPATIRRATGFFVEDLSDGAATVAPFRDVCDEFVFGDMGAPADNLIGAVRAALA